MQHTTGARHLTAAGGLTRRAFGVSITSALLAACSKGSDAKADTLYVGDQRGGSRVVLNAAGKLSGLPYKVEWATFPNAAPLLEALNAGAIDTGIGGDAAFIPAMASGAAIKAIGAQKYTGLGSVLVVRGDSSMRSLADMAGKTIATTRGSIAHNFVLATLEKQGRPFDAVRLAFMPPSDGLAALQSGAVDAWAVWDPNATVAAQGGARIIHAEGYVTSYTLLFASDGAISSKRLILQDYRRRLYAGWEWAAQHRDAYSELMHRETGIPLDIWKTVNKRTIRTGVPIDDTLIAYEQQTADRYFRAGLLPRKLDVGKGFDRSFS